MIGAFHGAMPSTTPAGSRTAIARQPGLSEGMISPVIWVVSAAASRMIPAASIRLNPAQALVAPVSAIAASMIVGPLSSSASAALFNSARLALGPSADQPGKAACARSTIVTACPTDIVIALSLLISYVIKHNISTCPGRGFLVAPAPRRIAGRMQMSANAIRNTPKNVSAIAPFAPKLFLAAVFIAAALTKLEGRWVCP
jgi:hypothetical protein